MQPSAIAAQPGIAVPPSDRAGSAAGISARMDRLPTTRHLWVLVLLLSLGGWFEIYDLIFTGYIAPGLTKSGLLATTTETFFGLRGIAGFIAGRRGILRIENPPATDRQLLQVPQCKLREAQGCSETRFAGECAERR